MIEFSDLGRWAWSLTAYLLPAGMVAAGAVVLFWRHSVKATRRKSAARRSMAIRAYIGRNGSGKTWTMFFDLLPDIRAGRKILSTTPVYDPDNGGLYANYVPLTSWLQFLDAEDCVIVLDEVAGVADARNWQNVPAQMGLMLQQLRKRNVILCWSGIRYALADANLRRLTWGVVECKSMLPTSRRDPWSSRRVIVASLFDAADFDSFDQQALQPGQSKLATRPKLLHRAGFWRARHAANRAYSTTDQTLALDSAESGGTCIRCHGRKKVKACVCSADELAGLGIVGASAGPGPAQGAPTCLSVRGSSAVDPANDDDERQPTQPSLSTTAFAVSGVGCEGEGCTESVPPGTAA